MKKHSKASKKSARKTPSIDDVIAPMRKMARDLREIYVESHEYREATDADFKGRDRKWYDTTTRKLNRLGYRHLGDVVNQTVANAAGLVVVLRRFISKDGTNMAAIFQFVRPNFLTGKPLDLRICDVESEFTDGSFLTSSNAESAKAASMPPQIRDTKYPTKTTIPKLIALHDAAKRKLLDEQPELRSVEIRTPDDYQAAQHRQEAIKAAFRQGIGYLDPAEVRRIAEQKMPDDPAAAAIATASADIARRQEQPGDSPAPLLLSLMTARDQGKSNEEVANLAANAMLSRLPGDVPESKRGQIADTMKNFFASAGSEDRSAGMKNLFTLMGQLQELEPKEEKERKRNDFMETLAKGKIEQEKREAAHVKERLSRGLSAKAGTGDPGPQVAIYALPLPELDYKRVKTLGDMNKAKAKRDEKALADMPLGHSRIGGLPDLPPGHSWPTFKGKKIPFVAQINLADCPKSVHSLLPKHGQLYAFSLISNEKEHWPPPTSVFVYEGETSSLVRAKRPAEDDIWPDWGNERVYEILPATTKKSGAAKKRADEEENSLGWLLGEMEDYFGTPGEIADDLFEDGGDWINLLAVQSVGSMQWSDCGHLYVLIRRSALIARDFSKTVSLACSS